MRVPFRQGIVKIPTTGFLNYESGNRSWTLMVSDRNVTLTLAHRGVDYLFTEQNQILSAWSNPPGGFDIGKNYWLYWDFSLLDFSRTFGFTELEPVIQASEPGISDAHIVAIMESSSPATASFTVEGKYVPVTGRELVVYDSPGSPNIDGTYTIISSSYDSILARTEIFVQEPIPVDVVTGSPPSGGIVAFDLDSSGLPMKTPGRMWYQVGTGNEINWEWSGTQWVEVIRVFAARVNGFVSSGMSINQGSIFTGTQIGDSRVVNAGRPIFTDVGIPVKMSDNLRFFTTESNFYAAANSADNVRLESNLHIAQAGVVSIGAYNIVAYDTALNGKVNVAKYANISQTVIGIALEGFLLNETGAVLLQGVVINAGWDWSNHIGKPLWTDDVGNLTVIDPHLDDPITHAVGQVPIARVLEPDTIIFEQGLGGKGDKGPRGSAGGELPATTTELGIVTISVPAIDPEMPCAIGCNDPILTAPRPPQPHTHPATDITVDAAGTCFPTSANVQEALVRICNIIPDEATEISVTTIACVPTATNVQEALDDFCDIIPDEATEISVSPIGCFSTAGNVQEALEEICDGVLVAIPYDIVFYNQGPITSGDDILGVFLSPRDILIPGSFGSPTPLHIAVAGLSGASNATDLIIDLLEDPYDSSPVSIGTVEFPLNLGSPVGGVPQSGIVTIPSDIIIHSGDFVRLRVDSGGSWDSILQQISVTIVGCAPLGGGCNF